MTKIKGSFPGLLKQGQVKKGSETWSWAVTDHTLQMGVGGETDRYTETDRQTWRDRKGWADTLGNRYIYIYI